MDGVGELAFEERLLVTRFRELLVETRRAAGAAADGSVLDTIEAMALGRGRELLRQFVETEAQLQADAHEKKVAPVRLATKRGGTKATVRSPS